MVNRLLRLKQGLRIEDYRDGSLKGFGEFLFFLGRLTHGVFTGARLGLPGCLTYCGFRTAASIRHFFCTDNTGGSESDFKG